MICIEVHKARVFVPAESSHPPGGLFLTFDILRRESNVNFTSVVTRSPDGECVIPVLTKHHIVRPCRVGSTSMYLTLPEMTSPSLLGKESRLNLLKPTGYVMHQQFNTEQLYVLPTLYLCV